ncbi:hypothetical protein A1O1_07951 [Capronia coronata CBS 617.96]|uniref:Acyltransferase 3 domain-containing protein n=1 Tax=Capronia coronata CBS 617.96 TaxID=1182541 RepID=W9XY76_9EURO|nr:uncharacterized protein A1O1_07951 [Capronia coronata CBS 617.96]EXJ81886.1 hypothetical protein A1O1_07951 [Capronia coronata CBS 617.96]
MEEKALFADYEDPAFSSASHRGASKHFISKAASSLQPSNALKLSKRFAYCFTPQAVRSYCFGDSGPPPKRFPTSYLSGLRGLTALKVFTFHWTFAFSDLGYKPYGTTERYTYFLELPIIRYIHSGFTAHIFFAVAGYLTSLRLFQILDRHDQASQTKAFVNISGALFRRAFRLYLPTFIITLLFTHYIHFGFYEHNRPYLDDHEKLFPGVWQEPKPELMASYYAQLRYWASEMFQLTNIFLPTTAYYPFIDQHLWSILAEMRGSLCLYFVLMATAQCRTYIRLTMLCCMTVLFFLWNHWEVWIYLLGGIVAQINMIMGDPESDKDKKSTMGGLLAPPSRSPSTQFIGSSSGKSSSTSSSAWIQITPPTTLRAYVRTFWFLVAFYFLSYPIWGCEPTETAIGYQTLNMLIPEWMERKDKFYPNLGTALLLLLLARSYDSTSNWRRLLNSDIAQYMGKISFGLYLTHGPVLHAVGYMIPQYIWWGMGVEGVDTTNTVWFVVLFIGWAISLTLCLCVADVWTREVEGRCVKFVKKIEELCFVRV